MAHKFLVSTSHHLLAVDVKTQQVRLVHSGSGLYYGLARDEAGLLYVGCRNSVLGPHDELARASETGTVLVLDSSFQVIRILRPSFPLRDIHGIYCLEQRLWITCSFDNMVSIYDLSTETWSRWYPAPNPEDRGRDVHHFNTVGAFNSSIYLVAHHFGPSEILFFDRFTLQLTSSLALGVEAHDVFLFDGAVATCSSREGCLINTNGQRLRTGNFPRGIAVTSDGTLLGLSGISTRAERASQNGVLRWYSPDWRFRADYLLPQVGMVLDVMAVNEEQHDWDALANWPGASVTSSTYNSWSPGNRYTPQSFASSCAKSNLVAWHPHEHTHCWTAAKRAALSIVINPGETRLQIELGSAHPHAFEAEVWLNMTLLGTIHFAGPSVRQDDFRIPTHVSGHAVLAFGVAHLWRPSDAIPGSTDERLVGISVHGVSIGYW